MEGIVKSVLTSMSSVKKPQRLFLRGVVFNVEIISRQGGVSFRNLSRYREMHEKRVSRCCRRTFDFAQFNARLIDNELPSDHESIAVISIASWKRKKFNQHLMLRLFDQLGRSRDSEKKPRLFDEVSDYRMIAA